MKRNKRLIDGALNNPQLRKAVLKATDHSLAGRERVIADYQDNLDEIRDEIRAARQTSIDRNEELLLQFAGNFTESGGVIHWAKSGSDACSAVLDILRSHKATQGVKAKSMVTEEIELGAALEKAGVDAVESDLGEFIVQLAKEPPSHITAPALHKSKEQIGELFKEKLKVEYSDDAQQLTRIARKILRERFLNAQIGISGVNFFIAETGHLMVVENEGNGRMGMSLPPLFIAVTGMEKVLATLQDAASVLKLLGRSATGQRATSYVHLLKPGREGEDGPREMHLVILDNGRKSAMRDVKMREMMLCIRCGACLNVCPVYRSVGGHAYGSTYPGPMGAVLSNFVGEHRQKHTNLPDLSTLCGSCRDICPARIDLPRMLLELRSRRDKPLAESLAARSWNLAMSTKARYEAAGTLGKFAGTMLPKNLTQGLTSHDKSFREMIDDDD